jgi:transposase
MRHTPERHQEAADRTVKDIRRKTRKRYARQCRQEGIAQGMYYSWSKEFLEAGKKRLAGDTAREANTGEVKDLRREARDLKEVVAEQTLELRLLKKSMIGDGGDEE